MNDDLRARIGRALAALGATGYRDTTNPRTRPQWRAAFSYHGQMKGETRYLQLFVPADADLVQVNCTVEAPAVDAAPANRLQAFLDDVAGEYAPGGQRWDSILAELAIDPQGVRDWDVGMVLHSGINHRMVLVRITMPLANLSDQSLALATRIGYSLAQDARKALTTRWSMLRGDS